MLDAFANELILNNITSEECGISPQQFETGLKYLETQHYIEIIHRG